LRRLKVESGLPFDDLAKQLRAAVSRLAASVDREQRPTYYFDMDEFSVLVPC
jgi:hypothetical protein